MLLAYLPTSAAPRSVVFGIRILYSLLLPHLMPADGGAKMALRRMDILGRQCPSAIVCSQQTIICPDQTIVCSDQTIVCSDQTIRDLE
ncbi:hypothetical protein [Alloprevotella tannerae]|uniref:Uncharacterized protein n=1 Tax=Alloprevotella tannerae TaxID=76122 RepID=A0A929RYV4_9BACT|nr:hypothetical protein [Alloprevotella tannerae]MBF0970372.1 hypothetical protein [Alloprevotella tannerae]